MQICENIFWKNFSFLNFRRGWWQISGDYITGEIALAMRAIAKRFVGGLAATAESDGSTSGEAEFVSGWIDDLEVALD
jgi:hypothetical protein